MNSKLKKSLAFLLCLAMMIPSAASAYADDAPAEDTSAESSESAEEEEEEEEAPRTEEEAMALMEQISSKGDLTLYMNSKEGTLALEDKKSGKIWWSNPVDLETSNAKLSQKQELASGMTLTYGEPFPRSTTTQNSHGKGSYKTEKITDGVRITYSFDQPGIDIPVEFTLQDGYLKLYIDTKQIHENNPSSYDGQLVCDLALMTTFGAAGLEDEGYFVVPDGGGAVIEFNNGKTGMKTYTGIVYGRNITIVKTQKQAVIQNVNMPMFGIVKQGKDGGQDAGLMVVADKGDTCASINSYVSNQQNTDYNSTYFDFELRTQDEYLMGGESNPLKVFEKRGILVPEVEVRYYPVSSDDGKVDYVDIAEKYREYLINDKGVVDKDLTDSSSLFLDLYGGTLKTESVAGLPVTVKEPVTTFATAQYLLQTLNSNGVDDMVVAYHKYSDDDIGEKITDSFNPASKLGGKSKFKSLKSYAEANNIKLFPSVTNLTYKTGNGYWNMTNTAMRVSNAYAQISEFDRAHGIANEYYDPLSLFTPDSYNKAFTKLLKSYRKNGITNYSFGTLSNTIYGDYSKKAVSREKAKGIITDIYADAKTDGTVLADNAAAYVLPYADYIANVPSYSSKFDLFDYEIPFYQMVMHGITPYAGCAVNSEADIAEAILTDLAAGSNLSFDFVGIPAAELKDTKLDKYYYAYYANWADEAAKLYSLANEVLTPAADATIVSYEITHEGNEIETTYSNGYKTVVNFKKKSIEADGKTYKLSDYLGEEVLGK
ncbi:MAG: hypothetical protein K2N72_13385 [Oscillospiraceae bacterium]|nr:hypothetical protein [Oscillospiraceae bacterium]